MCVCWAAAQSRSKTNMDVFAKSSLFSAPSGAGEYDIEGAATLSVAPAPPAAILAGREAGFFCVLLWRGADGQPLRRSAVGRGWARRWRRGARPPPLLF
jgi:hypothetical protein